MSRSHVLFLCTHNSARSQMAEGWLRHLGGEHFEASSAGSLATQVRPEAVEVMAEVGVELGGQSSKTLDRYLYQRLDLVVTVCDHAKDTCPTFPLGPRRLHWSVADPSGVQGSESERLAAFRAARDELEQRIRSEIVKLPSGPASRPRHRR